MNDQRAAVEALGGITDVAVLSGGHQSSVWRARYRGSEVVVKVVAADRVTKDDLQRRLTVVRRVAMAVPALCQPVDLNGAIVSEIGAVDGGTDLVMLSEFARGREPSLLSSSDNAAIATTLAAMHDTARPMIHQADPLGNAIDVDTAAEAPESRKAALARVLERAQRFDRHDRATLIHGDYGHHNLRICDGGVKVFDFDGCGVGPFEHDIAIALYLGLFDLTMTHHAGDRFPAFRRQLLRAYEEASGTPLDRSLIDDFMTIRVLMLSGWLANPSSAPIGVADATDVWKQQLQGFVDGFLADYNAKS